jgi:hypothetical protein
MVDVDTQDKVISVTTRGIEAMEKAKPFLLVSVLAPFTKEQVAELTEGSRMPCWAVEDQ